MFSIRKFVWATYNIFPLFDIIQILWPKTIVPVNNFKLERWLNILILHYFANFCIFGYKILCNLPLEVDREREYFINILIKNKNFIYSIQGFVKGEVFCFRYPYFYFRNGESTFQASQLTYTASQLSKDLNKVPLLLQNLGLMPGGYFYICGHVSDLIY